MATKETTMLNRRSSPCPACERAFADTFGIDPGRRYLLQNRTPQRIRIVERAHGEVNLAPLTQRVILGARLAPFTEQLWSLRQRHQLRVREYTGPSRSTSGQVLVWLAVSGLLGAGIFDILVHGTLMRLEALAALIVFTVVVAAVLVDSVARERRRRGHEEVADAEEGDIEFGVGGAYYDGNETVRRAKHLLMLLVVIVIGALLPAIAMFVATDGKDFLVMEGGLRVQDGLESRLVSRIIQVIYTAVLSLLPALLYFQFDRQRVGTIRGKWVRAIFRMDRQMKTLADVNARYGDELSEASTYSTDSVRFLGGRNSPILVATILITLGWTLLVVRTESFDFAASTEVAAVADTADKAADRAEEAATEDTDLDTRAAAADAAASEATRASEAATGIAAESRGDTVGPTTSADSSPPEPTERAIAEDAATAAAAAEEAAAAEDAVRQPFFQLLVPDPSAATMAFLGAYFFAVYLVLRGYFRGDLRPKIYNQISARLVTVVVLAYLMTVLFADDGERNRALWTIAFLAGVVPTTVLQRLGVASSILGKHMGPAWLQKVFKEAFTTPRSLTQIDGVDIYESARLESEGIADIPSLAKSDLVSMMINTRLPVELLVDWTDQAVLIVLLNDGRGEDVDERVTALRAIGIRTATSLLKVARANGPDGTRREVEKILATVPSTDGPAGERRAVDGPALLQWLAAQIQAEPSMRRIRHWRSSELADLDHDSSVIEVSSGADGRAGLGRRSGASSPATEHVGHEGPHELGGRTGAGRRERGFERIER
jgi:hypothetical protein